MLKLYLVIFCSIKFSQSNDYIYLVKDFVNYQKTTTKLNAYVCWKNNEILQFYKILHHNNIFAKISSVNSINYNLPEEHQMFVLDMSCNNSKNFLTNANKQQFFKSQFRWLIWNFDSIYDFMYMDFGVGSHIYTVTKAGIEYKITSLYKRTINSTNLVENELGTWSHFGGISIAYQFSNVRNRSNLMGLPLGVSYVTVNPDTLNHLDDYRDKHIDSITKNNYILTNHLIDTMNATIVPTFRSSWGYYNQTTKHYDGLIGDLQSGRAEIGGTPSFVTIDRLKVVDYTASTTKTFMRFIFRDPPLTYVTNIFTLPFDTYVWYAFFIVFSIVMVATYGIVYWEWKDPIFSETLDYQDFISPLQPDISEICIAEIGLITQQGSECEPKSNGGRIATFFSMLSLMFLYSAYSANIVALLQSRTDSLRSLEDILNSRIKLGVEDIVYAHYYFESVTEPLRKQIYDQKIAPKGQKANFMKIEEGIERMRSDFFAFHVEVSRGYKVVADTFKETEKCALREIIFFTNVVAPHSLVRKNTTYREIIKTSMERIAESGLQQREFLKIYTKKPVCQGQGSNFGSVGLIDCYALFLIFGIGLMVSIIILFIEIIYKRFRMNTVEDRVKSSNIIVSEDDKSFNDLPVEEFIE